MARWPLYRGLRRWTPQPGSSRNHRGLYCPRVDPAFPPGLFPAPTAAPPPARRHARTRRPRAHAHPPAGGADARLARVARALRSGCGTASLDARRALLRSEAAGLLPEAREKTLAGDVVGQQRRALIAALA